MPAFTVAPRSALNHLLRTPAHAQAVALIRNQRSLQLAAGFDASHDAHHNKGEIAKAARAYLLAGEGYQTSAASVWPWEHKPKFDPSPEAYLKNLTHAAAMIMAEMERILTGCPLYAAQVTPAAAAAAALQASGPYDGFCDATGAPPEDPLPYPQQARPVTPAA